MQGVMIELGVEQQHIDQYGDEKQLILIEAVIMYIEQHILLDKKQILFL